MNEMRKIKRKLVILVSALILVIMFVFGISYAYFTSKVSSEKQTVTTGNMGLTYSDPQNNEPYVIASEIVPITREEVLSKAAKKTFTLTNTGSEKLYIDITLDDITLPDALKRYDFMYALYEGDKNISNGSFAVVKDTVNICEYQLFDAGEAIEYNLYIWIEETNLDQSEMMNKVFKAKITANGDSYIETAAENFEYEALDTTVSTNEIKITGYTGSDKNVIIPSTIDGKTVVAIEEMAFSTSELNSVVIPNGVTTIGDFAFYGCKLTNVVIPSSVTTIGDYAFNDNLLSNVLLPNSITEIGESAFYDNLLTSIVLPDNIVSIGANAFDTNNLTNVIIPSSVNEIGDNVFRDNNNLTQIIVQGKASEGSFTLAGTGWYGSCTNIVYHK